MLSIEDELLVHKHSLDLKFDHQLEAMLVSHQRKLDRLRAPKGDLEKYVTSIRGREAAKWELEEDNPDWTIQKVEDEFFTQQTYYIWKDMVLQEIVGIIPVEQDARARGIVDRKPIGTTYYVDGDAGNNSYTGTKISGTIDSVTSSTIFVDAALTGLDDYINGSFFYNETTGHITTIADFTDIGEICTLTDAEPGTMNVGDTYYIIHAFLDIDQFTENARSAGDIGIVRPGTTIDDGTNCGFASDGTLGNPNIIEGDYDNVWRDDIDLSVTATATLAFGSKTITFSSDVSGVLSAGDWIYAAGDAAREFAYEVLSVSTVTVTLYTPYKGDQAGSGKTMTNMLANPIWNTAAGDFRWDFNTDDNWEIRRMHLRGTSSFGVVGLNTCIHHVFKDTIIEANGASDFGIKSIDDASIIYASKCRFLNYDTALEGGSGTGALQGTVRDSYFDGNNASLSSVVGSNGRWDVLTLIDCEFANHAGQDIDSPVAVAGSIYTLVNCIMSGASEIDLGNAGFGGTVVYVQDHRNVLNDTQFHSSNQKADNTPTVRSETTKVRAGGSTISIKITPSPTVSVGELSRILVFEHEMYVTTDSKTYTVFFASDDNTDWDADPTAVQLFIELEAWGHATNKSRKITKSTGTVDFSTDTDFDQSIALTVTPAQAGLATLRCWYGKPEEGGNDNIFYCDPIPV